MLDKINLQLKRILYHNSILTLPLQREALYGFCLESETDSRISCGEESQDSLLGLLYRVTRRNLVLKIHHNK